MANTLFIGKVYHRFDVLPSTNDWAAKLIAPPPSTRVQVGAAKSKPPEGTVIRADSQSAGRGQYGSRWESEPGKNLTLSVILYPTWLEAQAQFYLSMAVALSLLDLVEGGGLMRAEDSLTSTFRPSSPTCSIKWPNDLYLGDRKAAGILIQNTLSGQQLQASIVGIGLNVNQLEFDSSLPNPTSMSLFFSQEYDLDKVAERLFECLERRYLQLKSGQRAAIQTDYEQSLYRLDKHLGFEQTSDGSELRGIIRGVTEEGRLRVETENGEKSFEVKELRFLI